MTGTFLGKGMAMKRTDKVTAITKENYREVVGRADAVKEKMKAYYREHGNFPSLNYMYEKWGFNMSLKALWRHRESVKISLEVTGPVKPGVSIARGKAKTMTAVPAAASRPEMDSTGKKHPGRPRKVTPISPSDTMVVSPTETAIPPAPTVEEVKDTILATK